MSQFSMDDLKKRIQEQTVVSMGMMMPEEHLKQLVDEAITGFFDKDAGFSVRESGWNWDNNKTTEYKLKGSAFQVLVWQKVREVVSKAIDTYFHEEQSEISTKISETVRTAIHEKVVVSVASIAPFMASTAALHATNMAVDQLHSQVKSAFHQFGMNTTSL